MAERSLLACLVALPGEGRSDEAHRTANRRASALLREHEGLSRTNAECDARKLDREMF